MNRREESINAQGEVLSELLDISRYQWQCGDWNSLAQLREGSIRNSSNRAEIAILVAIALFQVGDIAKAKKYIDISIKWGGSKELIGRLLISASYINLSRAANFSGDSKRSLLFLEKSVNARGGYLKNNKEILFSKNQEGKRNLISSGEKYNFRGKNELLLGKRILIVLWFRSLSGGGLHENVRDTANAILEACGEPVVICPKSSFAEELIASGIRVIQVDFEIFGFEKTIHDCLVNYDLVHCHPGPSRKVGLKLAGMANCPLMMTIHGAWDDGISGYVEKIDAIVAVSQFIRDSLLEKIPQAKSKILLIPNGVDVSEFKFDAEFNSGNFCAAFVGRIDTDKKDGIDLLKKLWEKQAVHEIPLFKWRVAGDGPLLNDLRTFSKKIFENDEHIEYLGWLDRKSLANLLSETNFAIAAGRSGSEALASGCSTVLSGREGHMLVKNWKNFTDAVYSNFGGFGSQYSKISFEEVVDFVNECYSEFKENSILKKDIIRKYIKKYHNRNCIGEMIVHQYAGLIMGK